MDGAHLFKSLRSKADVLFAGGIAIGQCRLKRLRLGKVTEVRLAPDAFEVSEVAGFANEKTELSAFSGQCTSHMMADKSGGAC